MAHIVYHSEARIQLMLEVRNHPELVAQLEQLEVGADEFEMRLAAVAAYCDVMVDGDYLQSDLDNLCHILIQKLKQKNSIIILKH